MALDIDERHLLRLGHGEEELETEKDFSRWGQLGAGSERTHGCTLTNRNAHVKTETTWFHACVEVHQRLIVLILSLIKADNTHKLTHVQPSGPNAYLAWADTVTVLLDTLICQQWNVYLHSASLVSQAFAPAFHSGRSCLTLSSLCCTTIDLIVAILGIISKKSSMAACSIKRDGWSFCRHKIQE